MDVTVSHDELVRWPYTKADLNPQRHYTISYKSAAVYISVISMASCFMEMATFETTICCRFSEWEFINPFRRMLLALFQTANFLLLIAIIMESSMLVQLYVWCVLAFVVVCLCVSVPLFALRVQVGGVTKAFVSTVPEVTLLFGAYR